MKIKYINYGIGNRVGDTIYLNEKLKEIPGLNDAIIEHEKNHSGDWGWNDFVQDLKVNEIQGLRRDYYLFILKNPSTWVNFMPFMKIEGKWTFDISIALVWLFFVILSIFLAIML